MNEQIYTIAQCFDQVRRRRDIEADEIDDDVCLQRSNRRSE